MQSSTKLAKYINVEIIRLWYIDTYIDTFHKWLEIYFTWTINLQWQDQANVDIYFSYRMASFLFHIDILFSDWSILSLPWDRIDLS